MSSNRIVRQKTGKKAAVAGTVVCLVVALLQMGRTPEKREMDVVSSISMNSGGQIREHIAVLLNDFSEDSEKEIRQEILKKYNENTFHSIRFNQSLGELDRLQIDVYEDKMGYQKGNRLFGFEYPEG